MTGAGPSSPRDEHRAARAAWRALGAQRRRAVERDAQQGARPADEHALAVGQELARLRLTAPAGERQRQMARVFGPWSQVGASVVVTVETAVFLGVGGVPVSVGAAVVLVAVLVGLVGVLRLRADRRAVALLDLGRLSSPSPAAAVAPSLVRLPVSVVLPSQRRSHENTSTGPMPTV